MHLEQKADKNASLLRFMTADEDWAIGYSDIQEVIPVRGITPVPKTPSFVAGIVHKRGTIITVVDLAVLLGKTSSRCDGGSVVHVMHDDMEVGILVRTKLSALSLPAAAISRGEGDLFRKTVADRPITVKTVNYDRGTLNILSVDALVAFLSKFNGAKII